MPRKTPLEKLITKVDRLLQNENILKVGNSVIVNNDVVLFSFDERAITYTRSRYYPTKKVEISEDDYTLAIPLNHENLDILSSNISNPPKRAKQVLDLFRSLAGFEFKLISIGTEVNRFDNESISIKKELYDFLVSVDKEEASNKKARFLNRIGPTVTKELEIDVEQGNENIDYSLLLREIIDRGEFKQEDIKQLTNQLDVGKLNRVVIKSRINKQVEWLIDTIEGILEIEKINVPDAKQLGSDLFGYTKISISGAEELMEKILTDFGQFTLFGVPALLNTNKYVLREGMPRIQFDMILIDHLGEIEIVELKRPDKYLLEYGGGRNKFYPCKDLAIAIAQTERYISAVLDQNNEEQLITGQTLKQYINSQIGDTLDVQSIRPRGVIIMGSYQKICKSYESLPLEKRNKITEDEFRNNSVQAYKELKDSFKNIKILTYSELLEAARTRLNIDRENIEEEE